MSFQSLPYVFFALYYFLLTILELSNVNVLKKGIPLLAAVMMLFFLGLRGFIGTDWVNYYPNFQNLPTIVDYNFSEYIFNSFYEPCFQLYTALIKSILNNYYFYTFVNVLIDVTVLHFFLKRYSPLYSLSFLIFFVMGGLASEIDLLRNIKALMLFLISIKYIEQRNFFKFLLINLLGATFHVTSLFYIPFYFFAKKRFPKGLLLVLLIIGAFILILEIRVLSNIIGYVGSIVGGPFSLMINNYFFDGDYVPQGVTIGFIDRLIVAILVIVYYDKIIKKHTSNIIFLNAYIAYILIFLYTSESSIVASRFGNLFYFSYWILIPVIFKFLKSKVNRSFFLLYILIISCYAVGVQRSTGLVNQYQNVLFDSDSFEERLPKLREIIK